MILVDVFPQRNHVVVELQCRGDYFSLRDRTESNEFIRQVMDARDEAQPAIFDIRDEVAWARKTNLCEDEIVARLRDLIINDTEQAANLLLSYLR